MEHLLVDLYGLIFSDIEASVDRMLTLKLNKQHSYDLQTHLAIETKLKEVRDYMYETEKTIENLATNGAVPSTVDSDEDQRISAPTDLVSVLSMICFY
ncbi:unnamed protein product [Gongylonema pulchrum]|uniref:ING domain-containing protein n=1 Tax=Gongylonema pulchrum TaxID=637853 RepID=A0A183F1C4_9BILA|nr:unnamed protein product [Gongylonema pulchrum]